MQYCPPNSDVTFKDAPSVALDLALDDLVKDLIDDIILGECFEMHQYHKLRIFAMDPENEQKYRITRIPECDIFGKPLVKMKCTEKCTCCNRSIDMSTFTRHLQEHVGKNRESSRRANQRIKSFASEDSELNDGDDGCVSSSRRGRRKTRGNRSRGKPDSQRQ